MTDPSFYHIECFLFRSCYFLFGRPGLLEELLPEPPERLLEPELLPEPELLKPVSLSDLPL